MTRNRAGIAIAAVIAVGVVMGFVIAAKINHRRNEVERAANAFVYAMPLVLMEVTREASLSHPAAKGSEPNRFFHIPVLADHTFRTVVRPNVDTIYATAWLDLDKEPVLLTIPENDGRYYVVQFMDAWTNVFFAPGVRTLGTSPGKYMIAASGWKGEPPEGYSRIDSPTPMAWVLGRTYVEGPDDLDAARRFQRAVDLRPLSRLGDKSFLPVLPDPAGRGAPRTDPMDIVREMDSEEFYARFKALAHENAPPSADAPFIHNVLEPLGFAPDATADWDALPADARKAFETGVERVWSVLTERAAVENRSKTGWAGLSPDNSPMSHIGNYGTNYELRAGVALFGLGANLPEDAVYLNASVDGSGRSLEGGKAYVLTFPAGELPPVKGFWSVTLYDRKGYLIDHPLQRYGLRQSDPLKMNDDGSLTLRIQPDDPGAEWHENWLPSPSDGAFVLSMRLYWPDQKLLDGDWTPPPVVALKEAHADVRGGR